MQYILFCRLQQTSKKQKIQTDLHEGVKLCDENVTNTNTYKNAHWRNRCTIALTTSWQKINWQQTLT